MDSERRRAIRLSRLAVLLRRRPRRASRRCRTGSRWRTSRPSSWRCRPRTTQLCCRKAAFRVRFHSVGGYGTIATGKLLTDILGGALACIRKSAPKYGSEKSGAPTNYYITLSPEPVKITNAELEEVEVVVSPDHKVFSHTDPLRGPGHRRHLHPAIQPGPAGGLACLAARLRGSTIRSKHPVPHGRCVRGRHATRADAGISNTHDGHRLHRRGCGHVDSIVADASQEAMLAKIRQQITKKFGAKGGPVCRRQHGGDRAKARRPPSGSITTRLSSPKRRKCGRAANGRGVAISAAMCRSARPSGAAASSTASIPRTSSASHFSDGTIA